MLNRAPGTSPVVYARVAGLLYLVVFLMAPFAEFFVRQGLIVAGDAATTAQNIVGSESLFRAGFATDLVVFVIEVAQAALLYVLLAPVSRPIALVMSFARLAQSTILGLNLLNMFTGLQLLTGSEYAAAFDAGQLNALAYVFLSAQSFGYNLGLVFFALHLELSATSSIGPSSCHGRSGSSSWCRPSATWPTARPSSSSPASRKPWPPWSSYLPCRRATPDPVAADQGRRRAALAAARRAGPELANGLATVQRGGRRSLTRRHRARSRGPDAPRQMRHTMRRTVLGALLALAVLAGTVSRLGAYALVMTPQSSAAGAGGAVSMDAVYARRGPYVVGVRRLAADAKPPMDITIWYPALGTPDEAPSVTYPYGIKMFGPPGVALATFTGVAEPGAPVERSGAPPYPLVVLVPGFAIGSASYAWLAEHVSSYGFVVLTYEPAETMDPGLLWEATVDRPQELAPAAGLGGLGSRWRHARGSRGSAAGGDRRPFIRRLRSTRGRGRQARHNRPGGHLGQARTTHDPVVFLCDALQPRVPDIAQGPALTPVPVGLWPESRRPAHRRGGGAGRGRSRLWSAGPGRAVGAGPSPLAGPRIKTRRTRGVLALPSSRRRAHARSAWPWTAPSTCSSLDAATRLAACCSCCPSRSVPIRPGTDPRHKPS